MSTRGSSSHAGDNEYSLVTFNDDQLMFLANLIDKTAKTRRSAHVLPVHNGSSLFTGDAGKARAACADGSSKTIGSSDRRISRCFTTPARHLRVVLSNRKDSSYGKVQLINAVDWFTPLRKNLGEKGVEVSATDADKVLAA